jgi:hypothetical protein
MTQIKPKIVKYTLVEHNGLSKHVALNRISTPTNLKKASDVGALIFDSYSEADDAEYHANYHGTEGNSIVGDATLNGSLSTKKIDGQKIFIPSSEFKLFLSEI